MCGIVGCIHDQQVAPVLLDGLRKLEYRGYDSAGMATIDSDFPDVQVRKDIGLIDNIHARLGFTTLPGTYGIAHTRWATHGGVTQENAHPQTDCNGEIAVVHNGIIENFEKLRDELENRGHKFKSETDTEVIPHLIEDLFGDSDSLFMSTRLAVERLTGEYAIVAVHTRDPRKIVAAAYNKPLWLGLGENSKFIASDVLAFSNMTNKFIPLEDGDVVEVSNNMVRHFDSKVDLEARMRNINWKYDSELGLHKHHMEKEIDEQKDSSKVTLQIPQKKFLDLSDELAKASHVYFVAAGTSRHAGMIGKYLLSRLKIQSEAIEASEFEDYAVVDSNVLLIAISQSGETQDVISAVKFARKNGAKVFGVINRPESSLTRLANNYMLIDVGPEIGVAATKSYTGQQLALYQTTYQLADQIGIGKLEGVYIEDLKHELRAIPSKIESTLLQNGVEELAKKISDRNENDAYFIGRGINYATALEGALKLKEIAYVRAQGFPGGELKHGPLALIEKGTPVITIVSRYEPKQDVMSNAHEAKARGAYNIYVTDENNILSSGSLHLFHAPVHHIHQPLVATVPLQRLAYETAVLRGYNPDKPRNLAKSVTVK